jgi:uncharacterized protein (TIGR01244 family)
MRPWRHLSAAAVLLTAFTIPTRASGIPESVDPALIPNYRLVLPGLATAGQPSPEALGRLKEWGFKTVVNLRPPAEGTKAEEEIVRGLDLRYVSVPITPATFSLDDVGAVASVLHDAQAAPVLLHCSSANRVGAVWMALQVRKGKSREEAEKEARAIGLSSPAMLEAVGRVLGPSPPP